LQKPGKNTTEIFCKFVNMADKNLYIIAGCNGAGKTTASFTILPEIIACKEFVNADEIAKGLSPFQPEKVSLLKRPYPQNLSNNIMTTIKKQMELRDKILLGLEKTYEKLIEFKKQKKTELVVMKDGKVIKIKPE
jgi:predicted ABC-type ATPase